jgi:hypothetical protein
MPEPPPEAAAVKKYITTYELLLAEVGRGTHIAIGTQPPDLSFVTALDPWLTQAYEDRMHGLMLQFDLDGEGKSLRTYFQRLGRSLATAYVLDEHYTPASTQPMHR